jgi:hypothetical protein
MARNLFMDDKVLEIAAELSRLEKRRQALLLDLEVMRRTTNITDKQWTLVEKIAGLNRDQRDVQETFRFNLLSEIRELLSAKPLFEFPAAQIREELRIPASMEKSFYAALAKLTSTRQIRRVRRAVYQAVEPANPPIRKRRGRRTE